MSPASPISSQSPLADLGASFPSVDGNVQRVVNFELQQISGAHLPDDIHVTLRTSTGRLHRVELLVDIQPDMVLEGHGDPRGDSRQLRLVAASPCEIGRGRLCALQGDAHHPGAAPDPPDVRVVGMRQTGIREASVDTGVHTPDFHLDSIDCSEYLSGLLLQTAVGDCISDVLLTF